MKKLIFILIFIPVMCFSQGEVKLLKVDGGTPQSLQLGNFTFVGNAMYIDAIRAIYKNGDTLNIGLENKELVSFEAAIRIGNSTLEEPGVIRFNGTDVQAYVSGVGWINLTDPDIKTFTEEVTLDTKSDFYLGWYLRPSSIVMLNGTALKPEQWSGEGTTTLTLTEPAIKYDFLVILK